MKRYWKSALAVTLTAAMIQGNAWAVSFPDLAGHWAETELQYAVENGLLSGLPDGSLQPEGKLTRAQLAVILANAFGAQQLGSLSQYTDISTQAWYYDGLNRAYTMGIMQGVSDIHMAPDQEVTREQAMSIVARAFCMPEGDLSYLKQFSDASAVDSWAASAIAALAQGGYLTGMTQLRPTDTITRAEFAQLMERMVTLYYGEDRILVEPYVEPSKEPSADLEQSAADANSPEQEDVVEDEADAAAEDAQPEETAVEQENEQAVPEEEQSDSQEAVHTQETEAVQTDASFVVLSGAQGDEDVPEESLAQQDTDENEAEERRQDGDTIIAWQEPESRTIRGNVMLAVPDQTLEGYTIQGDLIVAEGLGQGTLVLKDTTVTGRLVLRAGTDVEDSVQLEGDSSIGTVVMAQQANNTYFNIPESCTVQQVQVVGENRNVWLSGSTDSLILDAENVNFYGEQLAVAQADIRTLCMMVLDEDSELQSLDIDHEAKGTMVRNAGVIQQATLNARDCRVIGDGRVVAATVIGRGCSIADEDCEITENIDTGLDLVNIQLTSNYDSLPVNQPLQITAAFTGVDRQRVCSVRWLKDGQPVEGFANDAFVLTEGKTSTLNWAIEPYENMPASAQFTLEITYDGETKRISKTIALENYSQEYYDKYNVEKILAKIQPAYIKVTTVRDTAIFENSNLTGQFDSIPKGTVCDMINYFSSAGKANIIMPDGRSGWVANWNISISNAKFTEEGDYEDYEKEIFVNNMGYSSKTDYLVWINIRYQKVNVFVGSEGNWDLVRVAPCATGKSSTPTDLGVFEYYRRDAVWDFGTYYVKPALRFNGSEAMHSRPKRPNGSILEAYMGTPASHGCVRMLDEDIWWLSDNLPLWSTVVVY